MTLNSRTPLSVWLMETSKRELLLNACASGNVETIKELLREWPVDPKSVVDDEGGTLTRFRNYSPHLYGKHYGTFPIKVRGLFRA